MKKRKGQLGYMDKIYRIVKGNEFLDCNELVFFDDKGNVVTSLGGKKPVDTCMQGIIMEETDGYRIERNSNSTRIILAPQGPGRILKDNLNILPRFRFKRLILHDDVAGQDFDVRTHDHYLIFFNQVGACALEFMGENYKWDGDRGAFRLYPTEEYEKTWNLLAED